MGKTKRNIIFKFFIDLSLFIHIDLQRNWLKVFLTDNFAKLTLLYYANIIYIYRIWIYMEAIREHPKIIKVPLTTAYFNDICELFLLIIIYQYLNTLPTHNFTVPLIYQI